MNVFSEESSPSRQPELRGRKGVGTAEQASLSGGNHSDRGNAGYPMVGGSNVGGSN